MLGNGILGNNPIFVGREIEQKVVFFPGKVDRFAPDGDGLADEVDHQFIKDKRAVAFESSSSDHRGDTRVELRQMKGFAQIIIGAHIKTVDLVINGILGGNDDDSVCFVVGLQFLEHTQPIAVSKRDIEEDTVIVKEID